MILIFNLIMLKTLEILSLKEMMITLCKVIYEGYFLVSPSESIKFIIISERMRTYSESSSEGGERPRKISAGVGYDVDGKFSFTKVLYLGRHVLCKCILILTRNSFQILDL